MTNLPIAIWLLPAVAFGLTVLCHWCALRLFPRWKLLDFPERYGHARPPIPYPTGIIVIGVFLLLYLLFIERWHQQSVGVAAGILLLGICSFIDDRRPLSAWLRLTVHGGTAVIIFVTGTYILSLTNPLEQLPGFGAVIELNLLKITLPFFGELPLISGLFTIVWLLITINALNWFDGIPGQVSSISAIGFLIIGLLSFSPRVSQPGVGLIACTLAAIAAGAALFDLPPPRVLIGDSGAMFFGLMFGILTIYAGGKVATAFLVLGVPIIDCFIVVVRRLAKRIPLTRGNATNEHLHHRLLQKGWSQRQVICLTSGLGSVFGGTALFLSTAGKAVAGLMLLCIMLWLSWYSRYTGTDH